MPWPFFIPEFLKRRACRYLLHHYLGQYLGGKISLNDLSIDLYNGTGSLSNVPLNVEAVNEVLDEISAPVRVVSGYIGRVCVSIPWSALMRESCTVEVSGLCITITPSSVHYGDQVASMTDSLFFSTSTSQQLAEEVLKSPLEEDDDDDRRDEVGGGSGFEGMDALAKAIETVLLKVQIKLLDTTVSICHQSKDKWNGLNIKISRIEFFDEVAKMEPDDSDERDSPDVSIPEQKEYAKKIFQLSDLQVELTSNDTRGMSDSLFDEASPPSSYTNGGTPVASAAGDVNVTIRMRQIPEEERGGGGEGEPKLDIEANIGAVHVLLYPKQLHQLIDLITDISDKVKQSMPSTDYQSKRGTRGMKEGPLATGFNRPIPQQAMRTIETQLAEHMETQKKLRQAERERQQLDPWDHMSNLNKESVATSDEVFYSFDLNSEEQENTARTTRGAGPFGGGGGGGGRVFNQQTIKTRQPLMNQFQLGGGVGLQQLSGVSPLTLSPPSLPLNNRRGGSRRKGEELAGGGGDDLCRYTLVFSGLTLALLEANPVHTYSSSSRGKGGEGSLLMQESEMFQSAQSHVGASPPSSSLSTEEYRSLDEGGLDPVKYFESVRDILHGSVNKCNVGRYQEQLGRVLPTDHLFMWMSTVRVGIATVGDIVDVDVSIASSEVLEFLYHNEASIPDIKPVSVQPLVQFKEDSKNAKPALKLKMHSSNESKDSSVTSTAIEAQLLHVHVYVDVTLLDRLHPLLHPPNQNTTDHHHQGLGLGPLNSDLHAQLTPQALFTHAMATGSAPNKEERLSLKVLTDSVSLSLRFPVADLSHTVRPPWYRTPLRPEVLFLEVSFLSFHCTSSPSQRATAFNVHTKTLNTYFSLDGNEDDKELFLVLGTGETETNFDNELNMTSIRVTVNHFDESPLDELPLDMSPLSQSDSDSDEFDVKVPHSKPSPFSQKKDFFSGIGKSQNGLSSDELLLPATQEEMATFKSHLLSSSTYSVSVSIPSLSIHIPSQAFLQRLYNRFAVDLSLWEPATPAAIERATAKSLFYSNMDMLQPAVAKEEKFKLCRSVLKEDSCDEDTDHDSPSGRVSPDRTPSPTYLSVSLNIKEGQVSLALPVKESPNTEPSCYTFNGKEGEGEEERSSDPRLLDLSPQRIRSPSSSVSSQAGVLLIEFNGGSICTALDYKGETGCTVLCINVDEVEVQHCARVPRDLLYPPPSPSPSPSPLLIDTSSLLLYNILRPMTEGLLATDTTDEAMLSLSIESKTEISANRKVHKCAVKVSQTLFEFHVTSLEDSFIKQVSDMFDLRDDHVPGYDPPTVITELHASLLDSAVQYKPLYIPTHAVLSLESLRVSSTLVTGSPLLVVKVLLDDLTLSISDKRQDKIILRNGFVNVMEMGSIDFILRLCNKNESTELSSSVPAVDFQCSGSELRFMMCVDSCIVFRDLLLYLSETKDLSAGDTIECTNETMYDTDPISNGTGATSGASNGTVNDTPNDTATGDSASVRVDEPVKEVGDLISEAMEDFDDEGDTGHGSVVRSSTVSEDRVATTTAFVFSSDSEGEETEGERRGGGGGGGGVKQKKAGTTIDDEWIIDEDDYCILSTPTTAKVGPGSVPVVKCLLNDGEELKIIDNYFDVPDEVVDQLKRPQGYPNPEFIYSLRELTIIWQLYGGRDFSLPSPSPSSSLSPLLSAKRSMATDAKTKKMKKNGRAGIRGDLKRSVGGMGRDQTKLVEIEISKLRVQHETYPSGSHESSRFVVLIHDLEIRDRLSQSLINKFLYQHCTDSLPRQSLSNMFSLKVLFTLPESEGADVPSTTQSVSPSLGGLEASVRLSLLPIRLNIDQDTFLFLHDYFQQLVPAAAPSEEVIMTDYSPPTPKRNNKSSEKKTGYVQPQPASVFIKSFVFYPDVPIRIDYEAKRLISEHLGTFAGLLLGLSHLDNSEVTLKSITYKQGILGWDQLFERVANEWLHDIGSYQLPRILQGVGPMYHVTQLFQGVVDLFWLPVQQYQEDGRIVWGLQRGTYSFANSSGVAVVELTNRILYSVQSLAQTAFDMVSPIERSNGSSIEGVQYVSSVPPSPPLPSGPHQSADLREGFANAYNIVTTGLGDTAREFYQAASTQHTDHGVTGAVGGVLRHIPGSVFRPIIFASEATRHVLGGAKNQFVPEAKREAAEKWKTKQ